MKQGLDFREEEEEEEEEMGNGMRREGKGIFITSSQN